MNASINIIDAVLKIAFNFESIVLFSLQPKSSTPIQNKLTPSLYDTRKIA